MEKAVREDPKATNCERPRPVRVHDPNFYTVDDFALSKEDKKKINDARKVTNDTEIAEFHYKTKIYDGEAKTFTEDQSKHLKAQARRAIWVWLIASLGPSFANAPGTVKFGDVAALLTEINKVLHCDTAGELLDIRALLAAATFEREGECNMSTWKFFFNKHMSRLNALGSPLSNGELNNMFLLGLPHDPFHTFRTDVHKHRSTDTFEEMAERARAWVTAPDVRTRLEQMLTSKLRSGSRLPGQIFGLGTQSSNPCHEFSATQTCKNSDKCRFSHAPQKSNACTFCKKPGHSEDKCFGKHGYPPSFKSYRDANNIQGTSRRDQHRKPPAKAFLMDNVDPNLVAAVLAAMKSLSASGKPESDEDFTAQSYMFEVVSSSLTAVDDCDPEFLVDDADSGLLMMNDTHYAVDTDSDLVVLNAMECVNLCVSLDCNLLLNANSTLATCTKLTSPKPETEIARVFALQTTTDDVSRSLIILDGGATIHATPMEDLCFDTIAWREIVAGVGGSFVCTVMGSLILQTAVGRKVLFKNVHISDKFPVTFLSESKLLEKGCHIMKSGFGGTVKTASGSVLFEVQARKGLFYADGKLVPPLKPSSVPATAVPVCGSQLLANFCFENVTNASFRCENAKDALAWTEECSFITPNVILLARNYSKEDVSIDQLSKLHRRLQHAEFARVATAYGVKLPPGFKPLLCDACVIAKSANHPHHAGACIRATHRGQGLHCDFNGPFPCDSLSGARYLLVFIDDFTGFIWDFYPTSQNEFFDIFHALLLRLDNELRVVNATSWIRTDNAKVFSVPRVEAECSARGIRQEFSAPYSQWQNGKAERSFRTILSLATASLYQSGLKDAYWELACRLAVVAITRIGELPAGNLKKGFEPTWSKLERFKNMSIPTRLNGLYPFGCLVYKHLPAELRGKFETRADPSLFLGLAVDSKGIVVLGLNSNKISVTAVFVVHEGHFPLKTDMVATASSVFKKEHAKNEVARSPSTFWPAGSTALPSEYLRDDRMSLPVCSQEEKLVTLPTRQLRQWTPTAQQLKAIADGADITTRDPVKPILGANTVLVFSPIDPQQFSDVDEDLQYKSTRHHNSDSHAKVMIISAPQPTTRQQYQEATPSTFRRAEASPHAKHWSWARKREVLSHFKNNTLGPLLDAPPPGYTVLPTAFIYRNKYNGDEAVMPTDLPPSDWKARLVVKGYLMMEGRDFHETFAPTASPSSIRLIAAIASRLRYPIKAADFETAFLNSEMDTVVYVSTPAGYEAWAKYGLDGILKLDSDFLPGSEAEPAGCRQLLKGVPGIKQGSRLFYIKLKNFLVENGFLQLPADPCVYYRSNSKGLCLIAIWVDDVLAAVPDDEEWATILVCLRTQFTVLDKGDATVFLGMDIEQSLDYSMIKLSQRNSIEDLIQRADMQTCNPVTTPCVAGVVWTKEDCPEAGLPRNLDMPNYRGLTALAIFISVWTRPDIVFVTNKLCKFMANPGATHKVALKRLCRYLAGTKNEGLIYRCGDQHSGNSVVGLHGYTDSSHMDCVDTSRSTIAFMFFFYDAVISWHSKLHGFVTTCTNHSEYAALFAGAKEAFSLVEWLRPLEVFLDISLEPVPIFNDNHGASALALDPVGRFKNKHVRMAHHYTQELVAAGVIIPRLIPSAENVADMLTKLLGPTEFPRHACKVTKKAGIVRGL